MDFTPLLTIGTISFGIFIFYKIYVKQEIQRLKVLNEVQDNYYKKVSNQLKGMNEGVDRYNKRVIALKNELEELKEDQDEFENNLKLLNEGHMKYDSKINELKKELKNELNIQQNEVVEQDYNNRMSRWEYDSRELILSLLHSDEKLSQFEIKVPKEFIPLIGNTLSVELVLIRNVQMSNDESSISSTCTITMIPEENKLNWNGTLFEYQFSLPVHSPINFHPQMKETLIDSPTENITNTPLHDTLKEVAHGMATVATWWYDELCESTKIRNE